MMDAVMWQLNLTNDKLPPSGVFKPKGGVTVAEGYMCIVRCSEQRHVRPPGLSICWCIVGMMEERTAETQGQPMGASPWYIHVTLSLLVLLRQSQNMGSQSRKEKK